MNLKVGKNRRVKAANIYDKRKTLPTLSCLLWRTKMIRSQSGKRSFRSSFWWFCWAIWIYLPRLMDSWGELHFQVASCDFKRSSEPPLPDPPTFTLSCYLKLHHSPPFTDYTVVFGWPLIQLPLRKYLVDCCGLDISWKLPENHSKIPKKKNCNL